MIIDISTKIGTTSNQGGFKGLLDVYSGAAAAYSLRKLSKATTSVVRVRRDSDNAEADFTALEITDGTLETWVGAGNDGLVTTWYDQSGNGNDATQGSAAAQPKIVSAGVLVRENGEPSMQPVTGTNLSANISFSTDNTIFQVDTRGNLTSNYYIPNRGGSNGNYYWYQVYNSTGTSLGSNMGNPDFYVNGSLFTGTTQGAAWNFDTGSQRILTSISLNLSTWTAYEFQYGAGDNNHLSFQERIIYTTDQSSNRSGIEANINKAFNIYWDGTQKGLLDTYTGAEAAYSLRALNSAYTGAILKVRRASDNAEQDIYAKWDGTLNVEALETFCAGTDGYVVAWYDQSGNANNATQATAASQPQIVSVGSIITDSGYQVIQYDGSDDNLGTSFTATGTMLMGGADGGAFYPVAISGAYNLLASAGNTDHPLKESIRVVWSRTLSAGEQSAIQSRVTYSDWDFSDVTSFVNYWRLRGELTSFPLIDVSNGTDFRFAWQNCTSLTSFPLLDVSSGNNFLFAWRNCNSLTSFPALDLSNGTNFNQTWYICASLQNFPANMFDSVTATDFSLAFDGTNLTQTSIDNILVSIDTAGQSGGTFDQSGGSAPSAVGEAAIDNLRARGWTVTVTGGY